MKGNPLRDYRRPNLDFSSSICSKATDITSCQVDQKLDRHSLRCYAQLCVASDLVMKMNVIDTHNNKLLIILIAVLLAIVVSPIIRENTGRIGLIVSALLMVAVPLASIYAFSGRKKVLVVLIVLVPRLKSYVHEFGNLLSSTRYAGLACTLYLTKLSYSILVRHSKACSALTL